MGIEWWITAYLVAGLVAGAWPTFLDPKVRGRLRQRVHQYSWWAVALGTAGALLVFALIWPVPVIGGVVSKMRR